MRLQIEWRTDIEYVWISTLAQVRDAQLGPTEIHVDDVHRELDTRQRQRAYTSKDMYMYTCMYMYINSVI